MKPKYDINDKVFVIKECKDFISGKKEYIPGYYVVESIFIKQKGVFYSIECDSACRTVLEDNVINVDEIFHEKFAILKEKMKKEIDERNEMFLKQYRMDKS